MRLAFLLLLPLAGLAKPQHKPSTAKPPPPATAPQKPPPLAAAPQKAPPQLKALTPAAQVQKQFAHDAGNVRLLILASPT